MAHEKLYLVSPPGRLIQGDLVSINKTDHQNRPLEERKWHRFFGLAIPKTDPNFMPWYEAVKAHAIKGYTALAPQIVPYIEANLGSGFSWKIEDGDAVDQAGNFLVKNDFARGCYLVKFSTTFEIEACNAQNQPIDPNSISRGWWGDVSMSVSINGSSDNTAGLYMNPKTFRLLNDRDTVIQSGPSIEQQFANAAPQNVGPAHQQVAHGMSAGDPNAMGGGAAAGGATMGGGAAMGGATMGADPNAMGGGGMPGAGGNPAVNPHHGIMDTNGGGAATMGGGAAMGGGYANNGGMPS